MSILPRRPRSTPHAEDIPSWLPTTAARRRRCAPGTGPQVLAELHATTDHLWPTTRARAEGRPPCQILEESLADTAERHITVAMPSVAERLAAIGLVYATGHQAVTS